MKIISSLSGKLVTLALFLGVTASVASVVSLYPPIYQSLAAGISNASVSLKANSVGNYDGTITFTMVEAGGNMMGNKFVITAPQEFSNLGSSQLTCTWLSERTAMGSQFSSKYSFTLMDADNNILVGERTCQIDGLKSPSSSYNGKTSGTWKVEFANVGGAAIFSGTAPGVCIGSCASAVNEPSTSSPSSSSSSSSSSSPSLPSGVFTATSATLSNLAAKATGVKATFKFTTTTDYGIPSLAKVEYIFPSELTLPSSTLTLAKSCKVAGTSATFSVQSLSGQKITLKRTDASVLSLPITLECSFSGITNPSTEGKTGDFTFNLIDSTGAFTAETAKISGITITAAASTSPSTTTGSTTGSTTTSNSSNGTSTPTSESSSDSSSQVVNDLNAAITKLKTQVEEKERKAKELAEQKKKQEEEALKAKQETLEATLKALEEEEKKEKEQEELEKANKKLDISLENAKKAEKKDAKGKKKVELDDDDDDEDSDEKIVLKKAADKKDAEKKEKKLKGKGNKDEEAVLDDDDKGTSKVKKDDKAKKGKKTDKKKSKKSKKDKKSKKKQSDTIKKPSSKKTSSKESSSLKKEKKVKEPPEEEKDSEEKEE